MVLGLAAAHHMMLYRDMQPFEASILLTRPFAPMMIISIWGHREDALSEGCLAELHGNGEVVRACCGTFRGRSSLRYALGCRQLFEPVQV